MNLIQKQELRNELYAKLGSTDSVLERFIPKQLKDLSRDQTSIPKLAKDTTATAEIESILPQLPTHHNFYCADSTHLDFLPPESVQLIVTSPPYWTLKKYNEHERQLGGIEEYSEFLQLLEKVWEHCFHILIPGGRLICIVGDVCLSRRKNNGRHTVIPLHASILESCRHIGYDNLAPIIWHKITNAKFEVEGSSSFLGKPYEPNAIIKNDIEFILMERKPGGYRQPSFLERIMSVIPEKKQKLWFTQIWSGLTGASTLHHPAPYPIELATRLIRMFSFVGDTVLDPFWGTGTTSIAASTCGRNSIGVELDPLYYHLAISRFEKNTNRLWCTYTINEHIV